MDGMATAILLQRNCVHLFDSHSLDQIGLWLSNGGSSLLKFTNTVEMERHIYFIFLLNNRYIENRSLECSYFHLQPVKFNLS